jgi:hypothetical protein
VSVFWAQRRRSLSTIAPSRWTFATNDKYSHPEKRNTTVDVTISKIRLRMGPPAETFWYASSADSLSKNRDIGNCKIPSKVLGKYQLFLSTNGVWGFRDMFKCGLIPSRSLVAATFFQHFVVFAAPSTSLLLKWHGSNSLLGRRRSFFPAKGLVCGSKHAESNKV